MSAEQVDQARTARRSAQAQLNGAVLDAQRATAGISGVDALVAKRAGLVARPRARWEADRRVWRHEYWGVG